MKRVFAFLILGVALAIFRVVLMVLAITFLLALLYSFITRPRQTFAFVGTLTLSWVAVAQPVAFIVGATIIALALAGLGRRRRWATGSPHRQSLLARSSEP